MFFYLIRYYYYFVPQTDSINVLQKQLNVSKNRICHLPFFTEIKAERDGNVKVIHSEKLGILAMHLGAGRATKEDDVNHAVGIKISCRFIFRWFYGSAISNCL